MFQLVSESALLLLTSQASAAADAGLSPFRFHQSLSSLRLAVLPFWISSCVCPFLFINGELKLAFTLAVSLQISAVPVTVERFLSSHRALPFSSMPFVLSRPSLARLFRSQCECEPGFLLRDARRQLSFPYDFLLQ